MHADLEYLLHPYFGSKHLKLFPSEQAEVRAAKLVILVYFATKSDGVQRCWPEAEACKLKDLNILEEMQTLYFPSPSVHWSLVLT